MRRALLCLFLLTACSGGTDDDDARDGGSVVKDAGTRDAGVEEPRDGGPRPSFCEARCDFETRCNAGEVSDYCGADCEDWAALIRPAAIDALASCLGVGDDCSVAGDEDSCFSMAAQAAGTRGIDTMLRDACTMKHTDCGDTFPLALCANDSNIELYETSVIVELNGCFVPAADCGEVLDCFLMAAPRLGG